MGEAKVKERLRQSAELAAKALFPGKRVQIDIGTKILEVEISPVGFRHIRKYGGFIASAMSGLGNLNVDPEADAKKLGATYMAYLMPTILSNGLDLMAKCVEFPQDDITVEDLPHEFLPPLIEAWITESFFGRSKWRPWLTMIENLMEKHNGKRPNLSEKIFQLFSPSDTPDETSSTIDNQD